MELKPDWEAGLRAELKSASSRIYQRMKLADPWNRALACCFTAQRIREKRTRDTAPRKITDDEKFLKDWGAGFKTATREARQRAKRRSEKGSWEYALKLKLNAWRIRTKDHSSGKAFVLPK